MSGAQVWYTGGQLTYPPKSKNDAKVARFEASKLFPAFPAAGPTPPTAQNWGAGLWTERSHLLNVAIHLCEMLGKPELTLDDLLCEAETVQDMGITDKDGACVRAGRALAIHAEQNPDQKHHEYTHETCKKHFYTGVRETIMVDLLPERTLSRYKAV